MDAIDGVKRKLLCLGGDRGKGDILSAMREAGWSVHQADDFGQAAGLMAGHDFHMGLLIVPEADRDMDPEAVEALVCRAPLMEWVGLFCAGCLEREGWQRLIAANFCDYFTFPVDVPRLIFTLGHAGGMGDLKRQYHGAQACGDEHEMVGSSETMRALFRDMHKIARTDAPVLLCGESGVGKELAARAIHERSARARGPFVAVNCGALPANLIQSELFGHEKGAFTGAYRRKIGRIEAAQGGVIFLDEIGDLAPELQVNLLRFLQEHTVERVGGNEPVHVDVRVIAATHVDLLRAVEEARFRQDLYFRLAVLQLHIPPLRERAADIEPLANYFLRQFAAGRAGHVAGFSKAALRSLLAHSWPGNVRELINRVRRATVMCEGRLITPADLDLEHPSCIPLSLEQARAQAERSTIAVALAHADRNLSRAARQLGVSRMTLYRLIERHALTL